MKLSGMRDGAKKSVTVPEIPGQLGPMQYYKLPRLPLDELHDTVNDRKRSADGLVAAHIHTQNVMFVGGLACGDER